MTCKKTAYWLQFYIDGRLDPSRHTRVERHLAACPACRRELALLERVRTVAGESDLIAEPADLTQRVLDRVAAYEAQRAAHAQDWLAGAAARAANWRTVALALIVLVGLALLQPGNASAFTVSLSHHIESAYALLLTPGPDSISWGVWGAGGLIAGAFTVWFARADASSGVRRAITQRLPQLW
jgi:anti-sigma factor RsiW